MGKTPSRSECRISTPLAAAALTLGLLKHGKKIGINYLHVSLTHAHASVLKATAKQHRIHLTEELVSCSACSQVKGLSGTCSTLRDEASDAVAGTTLHRPRWTLPNFSRRVAVRRDVRLQYFASTAAVQRARKKRGRHFFCRETLRGRYGDPTCIPHFMPIVGVGKRGTY